MVNLWNNGVGNLSHVVGSGVDHKASRQQLVDAFAALLVKFLLTPDEHPTLTRFCTFQNIIDAMLTMELIGMPQVVFRLARIRPREENQRQLKNVSDFFRQEEAKQLVRRASLVLQLTGGLEASTASNPDEGQPPPILHFATGDAHSNLQFRLRL